MYSIVLMFQSLVVSSTTVVRLLWSRTRHTGAMQGDSQLVTTSRSIVGSPYKSSLLIQVSLIIPHGHCQTVDRARHNF